MGKKKHNKAKPNHSWFTDGNFKFTAPPGVTKVDIVLLGSVDGRVSIVDQATLPQGDFTVGMVDGKAEIVPLDSPVNGD